MKVKSQDEDQYKKATKFPGFFNPGFGGLHCLNQIFCIMFGDPCSDAVLFCEEDNGINETT